MAKTEKPPADERTVEDRIAELRERRAAALMPSGPDAADKQHDKGKLTARERLDILLDNAGVMFWDPEAEGPDETGTVAKGMYRLMDGGTRYLPGKWPTEPLPFFEDAGTVTIYNESDLPASLKPADIPVPANAPANK